MILPELSGFSRFESPTELQRLIEEPSMGTVPGLSTPDDAAGELEH